MILCDPYAINFLALSAIKVLQHIIAIDGLPRDNSILVLLLRMLSLGLSSWEMIKSQEFAEQRLDGDVMTKFLPALNSLMVDDQIRNLNNKLPADERESAITIIEHSGPPPDSYTLFISENLVCSTLAMYYALQVAKSKDKTGLMRVMGNLSFTRGELSFEDPFLNSLVNALIPMADEFSSEDFCTVIFDEFFHAGLARENVLRHLLRLLCSVFHKLPAGRLESLMKTLKTVAQHHEKGRPLLKILQERVEKQETSETPAASTLE